MSKTLPPTSVVPTFAPPASTLRGATAALLRCASRLLVRVARRLHAVPRSARRRPPELEFYAEAGAPEGALYLDGELVGYLPGVQRL